MSVPAAPTAEALVREALEEVLVRTPPMVSGPLTTAARLAPRVLAAIRAAAHASLVWEHVREERRRGQVEAAALRALRGEP